MFLILRVENFKKQEEPVPLILVKTQWVNIQLVTNFIWKQANWKGANLLCFKFLELKLSTLAGFLCQNSVPEEMDGKRPISQKQLDV